MQGHRRMQGDHNLLKLGGNLGSLKSQENLKALANREKLRDPMVKENPDHNLPRTLNYKIIVIKVPKFIPGKDLRERVK